MRSKALCLLAVAFVSWAPSALADGPTSLGPTYALDASRDVPALLLGSVAAISPLFQKEAPQPWCAPLCDSHRINGLDRSVAGVYRPAWARVSDVTLAMLMATPVVVLLFDEGLSLTLNDGVVLAETQLLASGFASLTSAAVRRPRPYMYSERAPLDERLQGDGALSFFSGHTTNAFAASFALYGTLARRHPHSSAPLALLGASLAAASLVGASRILAGKHFPTDVAAGAVVGSSIGILVPALHGSGLALSPISDSNTIGVQVAGAW
jgi:membrane-associated phospholipid phosphatase